MRIGELAHRAGVTRKAVRYYEALGLLTPGRLANGYRDYGERELRLAREIRTLTRLGIPAERTRPFLECLAAGHRHADDCPASLAGYRQAIDELTERIEQLTARRATLRAHLHRAAHRGSCVPPAEPTGYAEAAGVSERAAEAQGPTTAGTQPAGPPVPRDDGAAAHLPGTRMPPLSLRDTAGAAVRLDALGPGRTVLYVYPLTRRPGVDLPAGWDTIPGARGCTPEACGFRDHHQELLAAGARGVFGLSSQDTDYQREVVERLHLPFRMLSDPTRSLARELGLPTFEAGGLTLYRRLTMIVRDGVIEHVFHPVFPPQEHAGQVLAWLREHPR